MMPPFTAIHIFGCQGAIYWNGWKLSDLPVCSGPVLKEKARLQALIFNLRLVRLFSFSERIRLIAVWIRLRPFFGKCMKHRRCIQNRFINVHALQPCILIDTFLPYAFRRKVLFNDPDIAVPVLIPSHSNGKIIGTFPFKQFRQRNYISTVTLEFFANSSSVITRWAYAVWL